MASILDTCKIPGPAPHFLVLAGGEGTRMNSDLPQVGLLPLLNTVFPPMMAISRWVLGAAPGASSSGRGPCSLPRPEGSAGGTALGRHCGSKSAELSSYTAGKS